MSASTASGNVTYCKCYQAFQISWKLPSIMTRLKDQEHHSSQSHTNLFWMDPWNVLSRILKRQIPICTYRSANLYSFSGVNLTILMINRIRTVARMSKSKVLTSVYRFDDLNFYFPSLSNLQRLHFQSILILQFDLNHWLLLGSTSEMITQYMLCFSILHGCAQALESY